MGKWYMCNYRDLFIVWIIKVRNNADIIIYKSGIGRISELDLCMMKITEKLHSNYNKLLHLTHICYG